MQLKKTAAVLLFFALALCGCSEKSGLGGNRWYIDDRNNTVRTVATFEENGELHVNYVLIDEGRAERTGVSEVQYFFDEYFFRDYGENIPADYKNDASDECAFAVYYSEEEFKKNKNPSILYYHLEGENLVVDGNVCKPVTPELEKEIDETIAENKESKSK